MSPVAGASRALRAQFFVLGVMFATWGVHVPTVKGHYGLGEQALAIAMLASGAGALMALAQAGRVVGRWGPRSVSAAMGVLCCAAIACLLAGAGYAGLLAVMLAFGITGSLLDVAINTEATEIERLAARPLMSGFHGMFSLGGMAGASLGSAAPALGLTPQGHLLLASGLGALVVLAASRAMLPVPDKAAEEKHPLSLPRGPLLLLGVLAAMGLIAEGAMYDWSVLYLQQELGSPQQQAALAYGSFSAAMAAARFGGDALRHRFEPAVLVRGSALLAAVSMTLVLLTSSPWVALAGFAGVGIGFANVVPILFAASARVPDVAPAQGIASVSAVAYLGFMTGPPVIGFLARIGSLTLALFVVVAFALALALAARHANPAKVEAKA